MPRRLLFLFFSLFVAMIGFGITLPVLPFFVERLGGGLRGGLARGRSHECLCTDAVGVCSVLGVVRRATWT